MPEWYRKFWMIFLTLFLIHRLSLSSFYEQWSTNFRTMLALWLTTFLSLFNRFALWISVALIKLVAAIADTHSRLSRPLSHTILTACSDFILAGLFILFVYPHSSVFWLKFISSAGCYWYAHPTVQPERPAMVLSIPNAPLSQSHPLFV